MKVIKKISFVCALSMTPLHATFNDFLHGWSDFNKRMREELLKPQLTPVTRTKKDDSISSPSQEKTYQLSDIKGVVPQQIYDLRDYLQGAEHFKNAGAVLPTGILLCGKPGTGKTSIARALANELKIPFFTAKASEFIEIYVGTGPKRIRDLFQKVRDEITKTNAPFAILFIDEIDAIGNRNNHSNSEENRTITELLAQMDGFNKERNIIIIAATNRRELIDAALLRPGRFEEIIEIPLPTYKVRLEILNHFLYEPHFKRTVTGIISLEEIARSTQGWSGAELESLINQAAIIAARAKRSAITQEDLDKAYSQKNSARR